MHSVPHGSTCKRFGTVLFRELNLGRRLAKCARVCAPPVLAIGNRISYGRRYLSSDEDVRRLFAKRLVSVILSTLLITAVIAMIWGVVQPHDAAIAYDDWWCDIYPQDCYTPPTSTPTPTPNCDSYPLPAGCTPPTVPPSPPTPTNTPAPTPTPNCDSYPLPAGCTPPTVPPSPPTPTNTPAPTPTPNCDSYPLPAGCTPPTVPPSPPTPTNTPAPTPTPNCDTYPLPAHCTPPTNLSAAYNVDVAGGNPHYVLTWAHQQGVTYYHVQRSAAATNSLRTWETIHVYKITTSVRHGDWITLPTAIPAFCGTMAFRVRGTTTPLTLAQFDTQELFIAGVNWLGWKQSDQKSRSCNTPPAPAYENDFRMTKPTDDRGVLYGGTVGVTFSPDVEHVGIKRYKVEWRQKPDDPPGSIPNDTWSSDGSHEFEVRELQGNFIRIPQYFGCTYTYEFRIAAWGDDLIHAGVSGASWGEFSHKITVEPSSNCLSASGQIPKYPSCAVIILLGDPVTRGEQITGVCPKGIKLAWERENEVNGIQNLKLTKLTMEAYVAYVAGIGIAVGDIEYIDLVIWIKRDGVTVGYGGTRWVKSLDDDSMLSPEYSESVVTSWKTISAEYDINDFSVSTENWPAFSVVDLSELSIHGYGFVFAKDEQGNVFSRRGNFSTLNYNLSDFLR